MFGTVLYSPFYVSEIEICLKSGFPLFIERYGCNMKNRENSLKRPEILAPAGSMESLKAAVAAGCDAVYAGGSKFGARAYADNPQGDEMIEAIRYCHLHGVKLYLTVNTLLKDRELQQELYEYMLPYYEAGLDAAIVQDVGVMKFLHENFPGLEIHASTQMTLTMGTSFDLLKQYGVTRIVPARELTLGELEQMRQDTEAELEVFVHGALCYCYSGQCLFSSMLGGRSGNRGRCAQPCRMQYKVMESGNQRSQNDKQNSIGEYLLSPKENCVLGMVGQLIEAGVDSFKIEGRMKRPEYVACTTAMYRKYIDLYMKLGKEGYETYLNSHKKEWEEDNRKLAELYNRTGFTSGYLEGKSGVPYDKREGRGEMLSHLRPKHGGVLVGKVLTVDKHTVTYELQQTLHPQDVVEFRDAWQRPLYEYTLGEGRRAGEKITARYQKGSSLRPGNLVYRTKDADLLEEIREKYIYQEEKLGIDCEFYGEEDQNMLLSLTCQRKDGSLKVLKLQGDLCQKAQKQSATIDSVEKILRQTGDTSFVVNSCKVQLQGELFLPVGVLKKLRRQALELLQKQLEEENVRMKPEKVEQDCRQTNFFANTLEKEDVLVASVLTLEQFGAVLEREEVDKIYLKMDRLTDEQLRQAVCQGQARGKQMYLMLPAIFRKAVYEGEKRKLEQENCIYNMKEVFGFVVRNMESYQFLTKEAGVVPQRIRLDSNLYIANQEAYEYWKEQGCEGMTLTTELTGREQQVLAEREGMQVILYTHIPLMVSAQCIRYNTRQCEKGQQIREEFLTISDRKDREFVVFNACKYCYNVIYQKEPLVLVEEREQLALQGVKEFRYDFSIETKEEVKEILNGHLPKGHTGHFYSGIE